MCTCYVTLTPEHAQYITSKLKKTMLSIQTEPLSDSNIIPDTEILGVFVDSPVTKKMLDKMPKLKMIATFSTGIDHIDLREAKKRKIQISNVQNYGEHAVAEYTLGLLLMLSRKLYITSKRVKEGIFDYHGLQGTDIYGKIIGIIGTGSIGTKMIEFTHALGAHILATDPNPNKTLEKKYNVTYTSLSNIIKTADIISLHLPLLKSTKHIINKQRIKKMKPGVMIINTARGGLIDANALLWGLKQGIIQAAALDVLEEENLLENPTKLLSESNTKKTKLSLMNNMIIDHPSVIVTPHNAFNSKEAIQKIIDTTIDNINAFQKKYTAPII